MLFPFQAGRQPANLYLRIYFYIVQGLIDPEKDDDKLAPDPPANIANDEHDQPSEKSATPQHAQRTEPPSSIFPKPALMAPAEHSGKTAKSDQNSNYRIHYLNYL